MASSKVKPLEFRNRSATWQEWAWFTGGCATVIITLAKSLILTATAAHAWNSSRPWLGLMAALVIGYLAADLGTGIYHWAIDNYGNTKTPIFGPQIVGFQGHHQHPSAITRENIATNLHLSAGPVMVAALPILTLSNDPIVLGFIGTLGSSVIFSQQFHAWSHTPKARLPVVVVALQDAGILLGRANHAVHHRAPYDTHYCIVSGIWNRFLDKTKFFRVLEVAVFLAIRASPRSWSKPDSYEWTEGIDY